MTLLPVLLEIILVIYALYCLYGERASMKRTAFWLCMILIFPIIGAALYVFFFRRPPAYGDEMQEEERN